MNWNCSACRWDDDPVLKKNIPSTAAVGKKTAPFRRAQRIRAFFMMECIIALCIVAVALSIILSIYINALSQQKILNQKALLLEQKD